MHRCLLAVIVAHKDCNASGSLSGNAERRLSVDACELRRLAVDLHRDEFAEGVGR